MRSKSLFTSVTPDQVRRRAEAGESVVLVDVRTPAEYARSHIPGVLLIPIDEFAGRVAELSPDDEIICLCEHGVRSRMTAQYLASLGYPRVATMSGGMAEYAGVTEGDHANRPEVICEGPAARKNGKPFVRPGLALLWRDRAAGVRTKIASVRASPRPDGPRGSRRLLVEPV